MPKKKHRHATGRDEEPQDVEPAGMYEAGSGLSPSASGELTDGSGCRWAKKRGPLDPRLVKRLVGSADEMIVGDGAGEVLRPVAPEARQAEWVRIKDRLDSPDLGTFQGYEFRSGEGRTLLYVEEFC
ncbi:hypothetical protein ACFU8Q_40450 [Streptomyces sp. NPDC057543]|uniref:hypothetical protein n=1 Tax=Streptomyces sp. NPDC057543 TaxID=3346163 RepID=UPI0036A47046